MKTAKIKIPDKDWNYIFDEARDVGIMFNDVLGKVIALGLYALRRDDDKGLYIHNGKKFVKLNLGEIDLEREEEK